MTSKRSTNNGRNATKEVMRYETKAMKVSMIKGTLM